MYKQCKTEHSAARQRQMEYGLMRLMIEMGYENISVSDLCDYMQIPRKSFYRYFSSKDGALYAMLDHAMMDYESYNVIYRDGESRSVEKELTQFFMFWHDKKDLLDALAKNNMSGNLVERAISQTGSNQSVPYRFLPNDSLYERKQATLFCISGLMSILLTWHNDGFPHSAEHMAQITARLISEPLFSNLQAMI